MITEYLQDEEVVAACYNDNWRLSCSYLNYGVPPYWQILDPPAQKYDPWDTHSHYVSGGWLIFGNNGNNCCDKVCPAMNPTFSAELLSGKNGKWQQFSVEFPEGKLFPSWACSVSLDMYKKVLITGGQKCTQVCSDAMIMDLETGTLSYVTPMPGEMYEHSCILTETGEVLVAGGWRLNHQLEVSFKSSSSYLYNVEKDEWRQIQDLPFDRYGTPRTPPKLFHLHGKTAVAAYAERVSTGIWTLEGSEWKLLDGGTIDLNLISVTNLLPTNATVPCVTHH